VILTHAYALLGHIEGDPLYALSGRVFSEIGVCGFFVISGYLIHQSLGRSRTLFSFARKRLRRLFPGLLIAVLFTTLVLGPAVSSLSPIAYFSQKDTWLYALDNSLLLPRHQTLPGVFSNHVETAVNGSLWTLRYEILCYGLLSLLFRASAPAQKRILPVVFLLLLCSYYVLHHGLLPLSGGWSKFLLYVASLGSYFAAGALLSLFPAFLQRYKSRLLLFSGLLFLLTLFVRQPGMEIVTIPAFAVAVIAFGLHYMPVLQFSRFTGDISYGTYIYAYPVQQALIVWLQPQQPLTLLLASLPLCWLAGLLSWHLVEKRFLRSPSAPTHEGIGLSR